MKQKATKRKTNKTIYLICKNYLNTTITDNRQSTYKFHKKSIILYKVFIAYTSALGIAK